MTPPPGGSKPGPARTQGPLGYNDHGDPNVTTLLGDTPSTLGRHDAGDSTLPKPGANGIAAAPGTVAAAASGVPLAIGSDKSVAATKDPKVWGDWTPPAGYETLYKLLKQNEGNIPYMYLDSKNLVTVGIGTYLKTDADATKLTFYNRKTLVAATEADIKAAYAAVVAATPDKTKFPHGKKASSYETTTELEMTPTDIGTRWLADVKSFQALLPSYFTGFAAYPADARQALTDIAYQYGASGASKADSGALKKAANDGDWSAAADCTDDLEGSDDRNAARKAMFQAAAKAAPLKAKAAPAKK
jgi:GH24 family phage-related lysozyme (muramidase)